MARRSPPPGRPTGHPMSARCDDARPAIASADAEARARAKRKRLGARLAACAARRLRHERFDYDASMPTTCFHASARHERHCGRLLAWPRRLNADILEMMPSAQAYAHARPSIRISRRAPRAMKLVFGYYRISVDVAHFARPRFHALVLSSLSIIFPSASLISARSAALSPIIYN